MSKAPFENTYHHRKVAENATKPCNICFKPTSSVLITPNNKVQQTLPFLIIRHSFWFRISSTYVSAISQTEASVSLTQKKLQA